MSVHGTESVCCPCLIFCVSVFLYASTKHQYSPAFSSCLSFCMLAVSPRFDLYTVVVSFSPAFSSSPVFGVEMSNTTSNVFIEYDESWCAPRPRFYPPHTVFFWRDPSDPINYCISACLHDAV